MSSGIYKITNKINGHAYIGLSKNIERRFADHRSKSIHPQKKDDYEKALYNAIRKYGLENFTFEIIEYCDDYSLLPEKEKFWISYYNTYEDKQHYNETPGGDAPGEKSRHIGEEHGRALLTEKDVIFCREQYAQGARSRDIWRQYFSDKITYEGFCRMWHGQNWKHVMPEVFKKNPHPSRYTAHDRDIIVERFSKSGLNLRNFVKSPECYVGYGTAWHMINEPEFYDNK